MTLKMGLMGSGISRSRMPRLQKHLGDLAGISVDYILIDGENIDGFDPVQRVKAAVESGFHGLNITHPYKQRISNLVKQPLVDNHDLIGSYNTLKFEKDGIYGANTDYSGFIRGYQYRRSDTAPGRVLLCGAGGVGRAIAFSLLSLGTKGIDIFDVNMAQAESLKNVLCNHDIEVNLVSSGELQEAMKRVDGLVNCTALGMYNHPGSAFPLSHIGTQQWAFDAVYTPLETEFIAKCRQSGLQCLSGFDLWIFQGIDAFQNFTGVEPEANEELISTALSWLE